MKSQIIEEKTQKQLKIFKLDYKIFIKLGTELDMPNFQSDVFKCLNFEHSPYLSNEIYGKRLYYRFKGSQSYF